VLCVIIPSIAHPLAASINDQPFPLPLYFGIGHLSILASRALTILWMAKKFLGKRGRSSALQNVAAGDGFVGSAEPVALGISPAVQDEEVEVAGCEWLMPEHDICGDCFDTRIKMGQIRHCLRG
jgi:hypothetical protein